MNVLVTGSEGLLGRATVAALAADGHRVQGYDLALGDDILDHGSLVRALDGCAACIHLAAVADLYVAEEQQELTERVNVEGTRRVAVACGAAGARLLYASTCCVYGNNGVPLCDEAAPPVPTELYARTKLAGEAFVNLAGPRSTVLRLATFYGPGMRASLATHRFLRQALAGEPIEIHGSGRQTRCYTHVEDVARGIVAVLRSERTLPCVNVATSEVVSVLELAKLAMQLAERRIPLRFVEDRGGQILESRIDSRLLRSLGWAPQWTLRAGLAACVADVQRLGGMAAAVEGVPAAGLGPPPSSIHLE